MLKRRNYRNNKNNIKTEINKINDKELEEEIKTGRKTKMMHEYNKEYLENLHFDEARAIFMMLT